MRVMVKATTIGLADTIGAQCPCLTAMPGAVGWTRASASNQPLQPRTPGGGFDIELATNAFKIGAMDLGQDGLPCCRGARRGTCPPTGDWVGLGSTRWRGTASMAQEVTDE